MIYKMADGQHIDLERVIGVGKYYDHSFDVCSFEIHCQLRDSPIKFEKRIDWYAIEKALGYDIDYYGQVKVCLRLNKRHHSLFVSLWKEFKTINSLKFHL